MRGLYQQALRYLNINYPHERPYPVRLLWSSSVQYTASTKVPLVRTACLAQDGLDFRNSTISVQFPLLDEFKGFWNSNGTNYTASNLQTTSITRDYLLSRGLIKDRGSTLNNSIFAGATQTIAVPVDIWNNTASSLGLIIFTNETLKGKMDIASGSNVMACSIDARWASGTSIIQTDPKLQLPHEFVGSSTINLVTTDTNTAFLDRAGLVPLDPPNDGGLTMIRLRRDWYDLFAPVAPNQALINSVGNDAGVYQTTLEKLLQLVISGSVSRNTSRYINSTVYEDSNYKNQLLYGSIISTVVADSLSRCGRIANKIAPIPLAEWDDFGWDISDPTTARTMARKGMPKESFPKPDSLNGFNTTRQVMSATYYGYSLSASNAFDYISIVVLLCHAVLTILHSIRMLYRKDAYLGLHSIVEVLAVALKSPSPPDPTLGNTSAGIRTFDTLRNELRVVVKARLNPDVLTDDTSREELRLRVTGYDDRIKGLLRPQPNTCY